MYLGYLESTQETRIAPCCNSSNSCLFRFLRSLCLHHNSMMHVEAWIVSFVKIRNYCNTPDNPYWGEPEQKSIYICRLVLYYPGTRGFSGSYMFSCAFPRILDSPPFLSVTRFPALFLGYLFPRPFCRLHVFPRFFSDTCFPALSAGYIFPRLFHRIVVFPRFQSVAFPTLTLSIL